jgi:uncharacterized cofD-like protein
MQVIHSKDLLSDLHREAFWQPDASRRPIEHLVEFLLTGALASNAPPGIADLAEQVLGADLRSTRVVILGGGTGLSTITGGNSQRSDWPRRCFEGAKREFRHLDFVVCTTDDGGSTGKLLKSLPIIGVGDLRKLLISSILSENLQRRYHTNEQEAFALIQLIHFLFNYRFPESAAGFEFIRDPLLAAPFELRASCPKELSDAFRELGINVSPGGAGPMVPPAGHALGNILLVSSIFQAAGNKINHAPRLRQIQAGIDYIAALIGAPVGRIHAATSAPGQLKFCYANGVEVYGQSKSAQARRGSPVERVFATFTRKPVISAAVLKAIAAADLIVYAPGSLYTSIIPILQLEPIVKAIRANTKALKILGANSWIQEGETDISFKNEGRGFLVSELIEAYDRNVPQGIDNLFDVVLSANLEQIPGNILRNYALEGKSPIHLDRSCVESMGFLAVEATLFSQEEEKSVVHHDARRFTLAIRTLLYADKYLRNKKGYALRRSAIIRRKSIKKKEYPRFLADSRPSPRLCNYVSSINEALKSKCFQPAELKDCLLELAWENRDIHPSHLKFFRGCQVIPPVDWNRSTEWDNVLGYYDPADKLLKLHGDLLTSPAKLQEDLLVALGESLLGNYIESRLWIEQHGSRCYEITLRPETEQECFLTQTQIRMYMTLARMTSDPVNSRIFRITVNDNEGFLPPGLLFGLMYAWYLNGRGFTMEYEMNLLRWPPKSLIPLHAKDRVRKEALVKFFRTEIFGHKP